MKNKMLQKYILSIAAMIFALPFVVSAQEPPRLDVVFTPDPLFSETSVLPGDTVSGTVLVTNNSGENQTVITEAINVSDSSLLSDEMHLTITDDDANTLYDSGNGTFHDFLTGGAHTLTDPLGDGDSVLYTFEVEFLAATGNEFQETELEFDLCVGFLDELSGMNCGDTAVSGEGDTDGNTDVEGDGGTTTPGTGNSGGSGGGGGGGGPLDLVELEISNERVVSIDVSLGEAVIAWDTNLFATSQVVYGLTSGGPYSLSTLTTNFGYPEATPEDSDKVLAHTVTLTGLIPGEDYSYRVVSRASPPTVSFEHTFTVEKIEEETPNTPGGTESNSSSDSTPSNTSSGSILAIGGGGENGNQPNNNEPSSEDSDENETETATTSPADAVSGDEDAGISGNIITSRNAEQDGVLSEVGVGFAAAAFLTNFFAGEGANCVVSTLLVLLGIYITQLLASRFVDASKKEKTKNLIWIIGLAIGALVMFIFSKLCAAILLLITLAGLILLHLYRSRNSNEKTPERDDGILHKKPLN